MPEIVARLTSPAALGDLPGTGFGKSGLTHIPGSVLRGAVAAAWIASGRPVEERFLAAFERNVHWGPLHLSGSGPAPMSWWQHKYRPGPSCPKAWDEAVGEVPQPRLCPTCGDPLERAKGSVPGVRTSSQTHVQLEDGTAAAGQLFMRRQIQAGQVFRGRVCPQNAQSSAALAEALELVGLTADSAGTVWLGGRRSSDRGRASSTLGGDQTPRLVAQGQRFAFMLTSPGIFVDDAGRSVAQPRDDELSEVLEVTAKVERQWTRWTTVGGWHAASRLPKSNERAVQLGSVFRVRTAAAVSQEALDRLVERGVGLRRAEGFGALSPLPVLPRGEAELRRSVLALLVIQTNPRLLQPLLAELRGRSGQLAGGLPVTRMPMVELLKNPPQGMVASLRTSAESISAAVHVIDGLTDPSEMDIVIGILRGAP